MDKKNKQGIRPKITIILKSTATSIFFLLGKPSSSLEHTRPSRMCPPPVFSDLLDVPCAAAFPHCLVLFLNSKPLLVLSPVLGSPSLSILIHFHYSL